MPVWLYEILLLAAFIGYLPSALWRRRLPHRGFSMRFGRYPKPVLEALSQKRPIWLHAVSVGEVAAARPLIDELLRCEPQTPLVLSTVTPGGFAVALKHSEERVAPVFFPLDFRFCVRRALAALKPKALILMESELWPTMIREAHGLPVPVLVVNGRISPRAYDRYLRVRRWMKPMMETVDQYLMQSREDADRAIALGAPTHRVQVSGSLKWDASLGLSVSPQSTRQLAGRLGLTGGEQVIVAGSTHRGEEKPLLMIFQKLRPRFPSLKLIIAPRHLERIGEVESLISAAGLRGVRLSQQSGNGWDVGIVDTFGQLPQYYGLASLVFIGGSLIAHGGQNPLEATALGKPVIFGRHMDNFSVIAHQLLAHHAAYQVEGPEELAHVIENWVAEPEKAAVIGRQAQAVTEKFRGATQRMMAAIAPWLKEERGWPKGYG